MVLNRNNALVWIICFFLRFATTCRLLGATEAFRTSKTGTHSCWNGRTSLLRMNMQVHQPLYITIGPPCAGKTTLLTRLQQRTGTPIHDVTLDGQPDVYVEVPTDYFLVNENNESDVFLKRRIQYKTLGSRIYNSETNGELRAILQRFDGRLTSQDFHSTIHQVYAQHANSTFKKTADYLEEMATIVIDTVEEICQQALEKAETNISLPRHVQLFCVESLFRPHPQRNQTGVQASQEELTLYAKHNLTNSAVAWGNTNTRPREYREALQVAASTRRPVYFIVHAQEDSNVTSSGVHLPNVGIEELYKRNIWRMLETGKFVPGRALMESHHRIHSFLTTAVGNLQRRHPDDESLSKRQLDQELARMASYEMMPNRTVQRIPIKTNKKRKRARQQTRKQPHVTRRKDIS